jgi:tRNA modification GTPase
MQFQSRRTYLDTNSTLVAQLTAPGGAIAVLRVSGPLALQLVRKLIPTIKVKPEARRLTLCEVRDPETALLLDRALWVYFPMGGSFTGEETLELHLHGNPWIAERVQAALMALGCVQALPGEFSFRAVLHEKMSLLEAQQLPDLFEARSYAALQRALKPSVDWVDELRESLETILLLAEVELDFSDQGLEETAIEGCKERMKRLQVQLQTLYDSYQTGRSLQEGRRLVLAGKPNAGKSSLFNALLGFDRALVTDVAGTTRDTVTETLHLRQGGREGLFRLEDTAGLRETSETVEALGVERSREALQRADLILFVVDGETMATDKEALAGFKELEASIQRKALLVFNKADRVPVHTEGLWVSAKKKSGLGALVSLILDKAHQEVPTEPVLTREIHKEAVSEALDDLQRGLEAPSLDLLANDVRHARAHLAPLLGDTTSEDLLQRLFADFCIGK